MLFKTAGEGINRLENQKLERSTIGVLLLSAVTVITQMYYPTPTPLTHIHTPTLTHAHTHMHKLTLVLKVHLHKQAKLFALMNAIIA